MAVFALIIRTMSSVLWAPMFSNSFRVMTVTGRAVSPSMRLMLEPVTSMRSLAAACCCAAAGPAATANAMPAPNACATARRTLPELFVIVRPPFGYAAMVGAAKRAVEGDLSLTPLVHVSHPGTPEGFRYSPALKRSSALEAGGVLGDAVRGEAGGRTLARLHVVEGAGLGGAGSDRLGGDRVVRERARHEEVAHVEAIGDRDRGDRGDLARAQRVVRDGGGAQ